MSSGEKSWEKSLRCNDHRSENQSRFTITKERGTSSPMKNTESKDYNPKDILDKIDKNISQESYIIADPFKPTLNKWIRKGDQKDCTIHHCKHFHNCKEREKL